jgi:hypothetical protein
MSEPRSPLSKFTFAGRMLLLVHLLLGVGGSVLYICDFIPQMPAGRYPIFMFVAPVALVCFFSFLIFAWILERVGIQIYLT